MKKLLCGAAVLAMVAAASPAAAQTDETHFAGLPIVGTSTNPNAFGEFLANGSVALGFGTRYTATADAPSDSATATPTVNVVFTLSGSVNKDCSFYSGNNSNARNIAFGVIGVRTGDNENVASAFEMVGPATAAVESLTAGCNTNNSVEIVKNSASGLVNAAPGGYDTDEFQANIPYSVNASWTGVAYNTIAAGSSQTLNIGNTTASGFLNQGAWRSEMDINFNAPAITNKGLVAGNYTGTTTLTLRAL